MLHILTKIECDHWDNIEEWKDWSCMSYRVLNYSMCMFMPWLVCVYRTDELWHSKLSLSIHHVSLLDHTKVTYWRYTPDKIFQCMNVTVFRQFFSNKHIKCAMRRSRNCYLDKLCGKFLVLVLWQEL